MTDDGANGHRAVALVAVVVLSVIAVPLPVAGSHGPTMTASDITDTTNTTDTTTSKPTTIPDWSMFHANPANTGHLATIGPKRNVTVSWATNITSEFIGSASPAVVDDTVYNGGGNNLTALDTDTGDIRWTFTTTADGEIASTPAVVNGTVYVGTTGTFNPNVFAVDADTGTELWNFTAAEGPVYASPTVVKNTVYLSSGGNTYALNASTGDVLWKVKTGAVYQTPAVANGLVYVADSYGDTLYALDATTGDIVWTNRDAVDSARASPAVTGDVLYIAGENVSAFNATTGARLWTRSIGSTHTSSSPAVKNVTVYIGNEENLYALNATTGALRWKYTVGDDIRSSPAIVDGVVYFGSEDDNVYALEADTGRKLWNFTSRNGGVTASPAVRGGTVYIGGVNYLYALTGDLTFGDEDGGPTLISSCTAITAAGTYQLTTDLTTTNASCLTIAASDVLLKGQGHTVTGLGPGSVGINIMGSSTTANVTIRNVTVTGWDTGIYVGPDTRDITIRQTTVRNTTNGVVINATNATLTDITAINNQESALTHNENDAGGTVTARNLDIGASTAPHTTLDVVAADVQLRSVASPPADPSGEQNISRYLNATGLGPDAYLNVTFAYTDADVSEVNESRLDIWKHTGSWTELGTGPATAPEANEIQYNITSVGSVFAPLARATTTQEVEMDVKPGNGDEVDPINPKRPGVIPVVIKTTDEFDASTVNVSSLRFGAPATVADGGGATAAHDEHLEDIDDDGDLDLVVHFAGDTGLESGDETAKVVGTTADGVSLVGTDRIKIVGDPPV